MHARAPRPPQEAAGYVHAVDTPDWRKRPAVLQSFERSNLIVAATRSKLPMAFLLDEFDMKVPGEDGTTTYGDIMGSKAELEKVSVEGRHKEGGREEGWNLLINPAARLFAARLLPRSSRHRASPPSRPGRTRCFRGLRTTPSPFWIWRWAAAEWRRWRLAARRRATCLPACLSRLCSRHGSTAAPWRRAAHLLPMLAPISFCVPQALPDARAAVKRVHDAGMEVVVYTMRNEARRPDGSGYLAYDYGGDPNRELALWFDGQSVGPRGRLRLRGCWRALREGHAVTPRAPPSSPRAPPARLPSLTAADIGIDGAFSDDVHTLAAFLGKGPKGGLPIDEWPLAAAEQDP